MQFLRTLLVALVAGLVVAFSINNWGTHVPIQLWGGLIAEVKLPFLLLVTLLAGLLPMWIAYRAVLWRGKQRNAANERIIADLRAAAAAPPSTPIMATEFKPVSDAPPLLDKASE
jgi:pilus assembly protein TadC